MRKVFFAGLILLQTTSLKAEVPDVGSTASPPPSHSHPSPTYQMLRNNQFQSAQQRIALEMAVAIAEVELTKARGLNQINVDTAAEDPRAVAKLPAKKTVMLLRAAELTLDEAKALRDMAAWQEWCWNAQASLIVGGSVPDEDMANGYDKLWQATERAALIAIERATVQRDFATENHAVIQSLFAQGAENKLDVLTAKADLDKACASVVGARSLAAQARLVRETFLSVEKQVLSPPSSNAPPTPDPTSM